MKKVVIAALGLFIFLPVVADATPGVGVGTGKIYLEETLSPGIIYNFPSITVFNTGDEGFNYGIGIDYRENAPELRPEKEWFIFEPAEFFLEPGKSQVVQVRLNLPVKDVRPGDYFAFFSAHPITEKEEGSVTIGIAAATKVYFTIAPANLFQGFYYRFISLYKQYHPWDTIVLVIIALAILITILRKSVSFKVSRKK